RRCIGAMRVAHCTCEPHPCDAASPHCAPCFGLHRTQSNKVQGRTTTMQALFGRWRHIAAGALGAAVAGLMAMSAGPQVSRVESRSFKSLTLTDQQFLTGAKDGKEVVIAGELRLPQSGAAPFPAVILIHGSGGIGRNAADWAEVLNGMGIATFLVD